MSLLQDILKNNLKETAAAGSTGAGAVAAYHGSLFGGGSVGVDKVNKKRVRMMKRAMMMPEKHVQFVRHSSKWTEIVLGESVGESDFDSADVISKLDAAGQKAKVESDAVPFGLEDEDGKIIKVYVAAEQADEFEQALGSMLAGKDEDENDQNTSMEIAEVLYELKDKFKIIDVDWGQISGDEEQEQEVEGEGGDLEGAEGGKGGEGLEGGAEGAEGGEGGEGDDMEADLNADDMEGGGGGDANSALQSVIDIMKADAEAKKAEADARTAEAKAKEAEWAAKATAGKVKQQEQIVDMETAEKQQKEAKAEADKIAKLARYQHQKAQDAETSLSFESVQKARMIAQIADRDPFRDTGGESEEDKELSTEELAALIMKHLRANGK